MDDRVDMTVNTRLQRKTYDSARYDPKTKSFPILTNAGHSLR